MSGDDPTTVDPDTGGRGERSPAEVLGGTHVTLTYHDPYGGKESITAKLDNYEVGVLLAALEAEGYEIVRKAATLACPACGGNGWTAEPDPATGEPINPEPCQPCDMTGTVTAKVVEREEATDVAF